MGLYWDLHILDWTRGETELNRPSQFKTAFPAMESMRLFLTIRGISGCTRNVDSLRCRRGRSRNGGKNLTPSCISVSWILLMVFVQGRPLLMRRHDLPMGGYGSPTDLRCRYLIRLTCPGTPFRRRCMSKQSSPIAEAMTPEAILVFRRSLELWKSTTQR